MTYWRINATKARHIFTLLPAHRQQHRPKAATIFAWRKTLGDLAHTATVLKIGTPNGWGAAETDALREHICEHFANRDHGYMVSVLYQMRAAITGGGLNHDPTREMGIGRWSGDTATNRERTTKAIEPQVFHQVVGNALVYVEQCADDILEAVHWKANYKPTVTGIGGGLKADHPVRRDHPEVCSTRALLLHRAIERLGGIPAATATSTTVNGPKIDHYCRRTLHAAVGLNTESQGVARNFTQLLITAKLKVGTPLVPGGLPHGLRGEACGRNPWPVARPFLLVFSRTRSAHT